MVFLSGESFLIMLLSLGVTIYLCSGSSIMIMVTSIILFVLSFVFFLVMGDLFLWGILLSLLYLGSMMVLFSYSTMLMGVMKSSSLSLEELDRKPWLLVILGLLVTLLMTPNLVSSGFSSTMGEVSHLWVYSSGFLVLAVLLLVGVLVLCLSMCSESWF